MKSLDINILVRLLVNDDRAQGHKVRKLLENAEKNDVTYYISFPVILKLLYVLDSVYNYKREEIITALESMIMMQVLIFEKSEVLQKLLAAGRITRFEMDDLLIGIIAKESGCETTITFDKQAAKSDYFELLK